MLKSELVLNIGPIMRAVRKYSNLQQWEFAEILGSSQAMISKIKNQTHEPELILWFRFLDAFNIKDTKCFLNNSIELDETLFDILKSNGSYLEYNKRFQHTFRDNLRFISIRNFSKRSNCSPTSQENSI